MKIGLLYVEGALPAFENFGGLPTHIVKKNGLVNGRKAHKVLDGFIIPGGSIIESQSINNTIKQEIKKLDNQGAFILGICSGFQILAKKTDIGRKSPCPIEREGLGLLDVSFNPLISNDRVEAEIVDNSFLTRRIIGQRITGFHCHTYGKIEGDAPPVFFSYVRRMDYQDNPQRILSGVRNDDGNVVGTMVHASLDENKPLVNNILEFIGANEKDTQDIHSANKKLLRTIKNEIGVATNIFVRSPKQMSQNSGESSRLKKQKGFLKVLMITSTGSYSGKTFITTGIVGSLRKKGYRVCVLKVGPDIRDIVPSLYLNKEKMEVFSSIKIGGLGWENLENVIKALRERNYDIVLIEGVMSIFTGMLNEKTPFSSAEIAKAANIPVILVSACNKGGIETAAVDIVGHIQMMDKMGIKTSGVILNKVYNKDISKVASSYIHENTNVEFVGEIPKIKITDRGNIPEVEIRLEEFCLNAIKTVENYLDVEMLVKLADRTNFTGYLSYETILEIFK
ncbi:MAG: cobyrinic acid a,c-diamide synthase [Euryarchaeota archaeon]|nr:cobyrinic acid a,c-diamide synthase [Euryarchaeota archaeon]